MLGCDDFIGGEVMLGFDDVICEAIYLRLYQSSFVNVSFCWVSTMLFVKPSTYDYIEVMLGFDAVIRERFIFERFIERFIFVNVAFYLQS